MSIATLRAMASGGLFDQVGGGFARYSVDARWVIPHFEKMLYDNALLARAYLHGWQVSGDPILRRTCEETLEWALREMRAPEGGFYSALDADSEGVEGKFYVWSLDELEEVLDDDAEAAIAYFEATRRGNHEGANHLTARGPALDDATRARVRARLLERRDKRVWPGLDDKRLAGWNALMISAFADAGAVLRRADFLDAARAAADFVLTQMRDDRGRLLRTFNAGEAKLNAYLEDHAFLLEALLDLYEATFEPRWFTEARALADEIVARFGDPEHGGFFSTSDDHEQLLARRKDLEDAPIPAGGSSAAFGLLRLSALTGEHDYERHAVGQLRLLHEIAPRHPTAFGHLLRAIDFHLRTVREVALVGPDDGVAQLAARSSGRQLRPGSSSPAVRGPTRHPAAQRPRARRRARCRLCVRALRMSAPGHRARRAGGAIGSVSSGWQYRAMTARNAVLTALVTAVLSAPASASAAAVAIDQECYAEGGTIGITGSGYSPNSIATLTIGGTTYSADTDATGAFTTSVAAPDTTLKHPGAQQISLTTRDTGTGEERRTPVNVAKTGVDGVPGRASRTSGSPGTSRASPAARRSTAIGASAARRAPITGWAFRRAPAACCTPRRARSRPTRCPSGSGRSSSTSTGTTTSSPPRGRA